MYETPNKVLSAAHKLGFSRDLFRQVGPTQWEGVLKRVFERFAKTHDTGVMWLWDHLTCQGESAQSSCGATDLASMCPKETDVWLLVEDFDGTRNHGNYWIFEGAFGAVIDVLSEMHAIEYYIVDRRLDWMVLENHHNTLIGVGERAESFVSKLRAARKGMQKPC